MMYEFEKEYIRNNEQLKAPNLVEYVSKKEFKFRLKELKKCKEDIIHFAENYFTIVSPGKGKHIIQLYDFQKEMLKFFMNEDRCICLCSRQSGKTTTYTIFALWYTIFHPDKKILIAANRAAAAIEFLGRIRLAYELLPNWLKPGVKTWNKGSVEFSNGSGIFGTATSESASRGSSCNILIVDEFAFIPNNIAREFWNSVYPIISSAKNTKVIIVSTPNGTGNLFYELWNRATLEIDEDGWKPFRVDWWEVPGRDEEWKKKTIESLGSIIAFNQEFGNEFVGSTFTLIPKEGIEKFKKLQKKCKREFEELKIGRLNWKARIYEKPNLDRTYILGADVGDGIGSDYSTVRIFDVTDMSNCRLVCSFTENLINTTEFSYVIAYLGTLYGNCPIALENNGVGNSVVNNLWYVYQYENLLHYGEKRQQLGIFSHNSVKVKACLWFKELVEFPDVNIYIPDGKDIEEIEFFEKKVPSQMLVYRAREGKHDDRIMSIIWAFFLLHNENIEYYFNVDISKISNLSRIPLKITKYNSNFYTSSVISNDIKNSEIGVNLEKLDKKFENTFQNRLSKERNEDSLINNNIRNLEDESLMIGINDQLFTEDFNEGGWMNL